MSEQRCELCGKLGWFSETMGEGNLHRVVHPDRDATFCHYNSIPCTRTYESLVGEKGKTRLAWGPGESSMPIPVGDKPLEYVVKCDCQGWHGDLHLFAHHPNCDGKGGHKRSVAEQWKGIFTEALGGAVLGAHDAKPEPTLSLLILDLGDNVIIKTERGEIDIKLGGVTYQCRTSGLQYTSLHSFADIRAAIDGAKPVPRIERNGEGYDLHAKASEGYDIAMWIHADYYNALSALAGKPLPIYNGGTWEELTALQKKGEYGWIDEREFTAWRYSR